MRIRTHNYIAMGYLAAMVDRTGYIGMHTIKNKNCIQVQLSVSTKNEKVAIYISDFLTRIQVDHVIKHRKASKNGKAYLSYVVLITTLVALRKIGKLLSPWIIEKERINILVEFTKGRLIKGGDKPYSQEEWDLQAKLSLINKTYKKLK